MKVYVYIKIQEHPNPKSGGTTKGDIIYIYPIVEDQGRLTLNNTLPVVMDLNIPCGDDFNRIIYEPNNPDLLNCNRCPYSDPDMCDKVKYTVGIWSAGDVENPPKLTAKRCWSIDRNQFVSPISEVLITNPDKTEAQKAQIIMQAKNNEQLKSIISEKL